MTDNLYLKDSIGVYAGKPDANQLLKNEGTCCHGGCYEDTKVTEAPQPAQATPIPNRTPRNYPYLENEKKSINTKLPRP